MFNCKIGADKAEKRSGFVNNSMIADKKMAKKMAMSMTEPQGCCEGDLQVSVEEGRSSCLSEGFIWLQLRGPRGRRILQ